MLRYYFKTSDDICFVSLNEPQEGCWIHIDEASGEDLPPLAQLLNLEPIELNDCLDKFELPRVERTHNTVLIYTRYPKEAEIGLYTATLTILLNPNYTVTITPHKSDLMYQFFSQTSKLSSLQQTESLIALLFKITQEFTAHIRRVRNNVLHQEKEMISVDSEDITALTKNEEILNQYMSGLAPLRTVLDDVTSGRYATLYEKDQEMIKDLLNAVRQSEDVCGVNLKSIRSLRDSYQIIFTNNLHKTIKLLTALTILFNIPTIIASLYGMNIELPFAQRPLAFLYIIGATSITILAAVLYFQRKHWL